MHSLPKSINKNKIKKKNNKQFNFRHKLVLDWLTNFIYCVAVRFYLYRLGKLLNWSCSESPSNYTLELRGKGERTHRDNPS